MSGARGALSGSTLHSMHFPLSCSLLLINVAFWHRRFLPFSRSLILTPNLAGAVPQEDDCMSEGGVEPSEAGSDSFFVADGYLSGDDAAAFLDDDDAGGGAAAMQLGKTPRRPKKAFAHCLCRYCASITNLYTIKIKNLK